eukprot:1256507-Alexandrium_andersonii.AAC.1
MRPQSRPRQSAERSSPRLGDPPLQCPILEALPRLGPAVGGLQRLPIPIPGEDLSAPWRGLGCNLVQLGIGPRPEFSQGALQDGSRPK